MEIVIVVTAQVTARSFVDGFAKYTAKKGHQVTIIADGIEKSHVNYGAGNLYSAPIAMDRTPNPFQDWTSLIELRRVLKEIQPDVVMYGTPKASLLSSLASFSLRIPNRIYQLRGLRLETTRGFARIALSVFEVITSLASTRVLANSSSLATLYKQLGLNLGRPVDLIGEGSSQGVDLDRFSRNVDNIPAESEILDNLNLQDSEFILGYIGRLHPDKGIDILLSAAKILISEGYRFKLLLVGKEEGADLNLHDLEPFIVKIGYADDPRPYYRIMDTLVLPSRREGFPNVILEASAMGLATVVSDATGVVDSVVHRETGLIFEGGNPEKLVESLKEMISTESLRQTMGEKARVRVEKTFDQKAVWANTLNYLVEIAKK